MATLATANGYKELAAFRDHIENDPKYQAVSADAIVEDFRKYIAQMQPHLPELFNLLPKTAVTVEPIPPFRASGSHPPSGWNPDGKRPGRVSVAVAPTPPIAATSIDEAVAYCMRASPATTFRSPSSSPSPASRSSASTAETPRTPRDGVSMPRNSVKRSASTGTPASDYGRLRSELFRAVRLVVDTGIHDMGWSRDQVIEYMRKSHAVDEPNASLETDRYISGPGQACSYKLGQLKIRELRERAKQQLGARFDLKTFHDEILSSGALPLDILDARVNRWIKAQTTTGSSR